MNRGAIYLIVALFAGKFSLTREYRVPSVIPSAARFPLGPFSFLNLSPRPFSLFLFSAVKVIHVIALSRIGGTTTSPFYHEYRKARRRSAKSTARGIPEAGSLKAFGKLMHAHARARRLSRLRRRCAVTGTIS